MIVLPADVLAWGMEEWERRKVEIQKVYAGEATWEEINAAMDKRIADSEYDEFTAASSVIAAQQTDSEAERERLRQRAKKYTFGVARKAKQKQVQRVSPNA